jgi:hypothetical protein
MNKLVPLTAKMDQSDRKLILFLAGKVAQKGDKKVEKSRTVVDARTPS